MTIGEKMGRISKETKDFEDTRECWKKILRYIETEGKDIEVCSLRPRGDSKFFHAWKNGSRIKVDTAENQRNSVDITTTRTINYDEFKCIAKLYNDYVSGKKGVRPTMRDNCGHNSSYVISLINEVL